jgi:hypothetical protein
MSIGKQGKQKNTHIKGREGFEPDLKLTSQAKSI